MKRRRVVAALAALPVAASAAAAEDFSPAEKALFVTPMLKGLPLPSTLSYRYRREAAGDDGFDEPVVLSLRRGAHGVDVDTQFLAGPRHLVLPTVQGATGNPVVLYFLEREVREMNRSTHGQSSYFRKRIRMAVYGGADLHDTTVTYGGRRLPARQILLQPYQDDPLRKRFAAQADKRFVFTLSDAVPGGVVALRSQIDGADGKPVVREELLLDGAALASPDR
jgi:hypothetical protein